MPAERFESRRKKPEAENDESEKELKLENDVHEEEVTLSLGGDGTLKIDGQLLGFMREGPDRDKLENFFSKQAKSIKKIDISDIEVITKTIEFLREKAGDPEFIVNRGQKSALIDKVSALSDINCVVKEEVE